MQNAHLRLGLLEYHRITEKTSTRIRVRASSYIGEDEQAHGDGRANLGTCDEARNGLSSVGRAWRRQNSQSSEMSHLFCAGKLELNVVWCRVSSECWCRGVVSVVRQAATQRPKPPSEATSTGASATTAARLTVADVSVVVETSAVARACACELLERGNHAARANSASAPSRSTTCSRRVMFPFLAPCVPFACRRCSAATMADLRDEIAAEKQTVRELSSTPV